MFNGNINNKHYTNPDEYYMDLKKLSLEGENFTASCSYSTKTETPCTCKKECSDLDSFIKDNVVDFEWLKKQYNNSLNKANYIEKLKSSIPYTLSEGEAKKLENMSEADLATLLDYVSAKDIQNYSEHKYICDSIKNIDANYKNLDKEREKIVNALKEINKKIEDLLKVRENYEDQGVMCEALSSIYDDLMKRIEDEMDEDLDEDLLDVLEEEDDEEEENDSKTNSTSKDSITIEDLVNSFKDLYAKFLA